MFTLALALFACHADVREDSPDAPGADAVAAPKADHASDAVAARDAVVAGDVGEVNRRGEAMLALPLPSDPALRPYVERYRNDAAAAKNAKSVVDGAAAVGQLAEACGDCHRAAGVTVDLPPLVEPGAGDGLKPEMARHKWAVEQLWRGLVVPSEPAYGDAVRVLAEDHLQPGAGEGEMTQAATELDATVHDLATRMQTTGPGDRGQRYGELLATCSTCHLLRPGGLALPK